MIKRILRALSSMKVGLGLMALLALVMGVGSVVMAEGIASTLLFRVLMSLMLLNMSACTIHQIRSFARRGFRDPRGVLRPISMILLHAGIVTIILGGIVGNVNAFTTHAYFYEGDSIDASELTQGRLSGTFTLDNFDIEYDEDGRISQYHAHVSVDDRQAVASVNAPCEIDGVKIYYVDALNGVDIQVESLGGANHDWNIREGETIDIPGEAGASIQVYRYLPYYDPEQGELSQSMVPTSPYIVYYLLQEGAEPIRAILPVGEWTSLTAGTRPRRV